MKNYYHMLTYEQRAIQEMVRQFADEKIIPICKECDITGRFPAELYKEAFELGLTTFTIPEKYGGAGGDNVAGIERYAARRGQIKKS